MKNLIILLITIGLVGCRTSKNVVSEKTKNDSIVYVEKMRVDTIKEFKKIKITEPSENEVNLTCDSTSFKQSFKSGKISYKITKEKGNVKVVFKTDPMNEVYEKKYKTLLVKNDSLIKISKEKNKQVKQVEQKSFFQRIKDKINNSFFWILFILWVVGITPLKVVRFIINRIKP